MSNRTLNAVVMDQYVHDDMSAVDVNEANEAIVATEASDASDVKGSAPSDSSVLQTPLAHVLEAAHPASTERPGTVSLIEAKAPGLLILRATDKVDTLSDALQAALSVNLPNRLQSTESQDGAICIRWMSPDEWLMSCPLANAFDIENTLRQAVEGHIAIVNVSGGYSLLSLTGIDAINVLKKSTVYDVSAENFPAGKVVNTVFAKAQVTLRAVGQDHYEILIRRSFADYLWLWLQRAGQEYGARLVAAP